MKFGEMIWDDGRIVMHDQAARRDFVHACQHHYPLLDELRACDGDVFMPDDHKARLSARLGALNTTRPYSADEIEAACRLTVRSNGSSNCCLRIFALPIRSSIETIDQNDRVRIAIVATSPLEADEFIRLATCKTLPERPPAEARLQHVLTHHAHCRTDVRSRGFDDVLIVDRRGLIKQTTTASIFFVCAEALHTPKIDDFEGGAMRQVIMDIARKENIAVFERMIQPRSVGYATEVFLASSSMEIISVVAIDECRFKPGRISSLMQDRSRRCMQNIVSTRLGASLPGGLLAHPRPTFNQESII